MCRNGHTTAAKLARGVGHSAPTSPLAQPKSRFNFQLLYHSTLSRGPVPPKTPRQFEYSLGPPNDAGKLCHGLRAGTARCAVTPQVGVTKLAGFIVSIESGVSDLSKALTKTLMRRIGRMTMANLIPLRHCLAIAEALVAAVGLADVVSMETKDWTGSGVTNGWRHASLDTPFSDGAARFGDGAVIVSPTFATQDVLYADVRLMCSTNAPGRFLQMSFLRNGRVVAGPSRFEAVFRADRAETQRLSVRREKHANGIALSLCA